MADHQPLVSEGLRDVVQNAVNSSHNTTGVPQPESAQWVSKTLLSIALTLLLSFVITQFFSPRFDSREPPPLKSRIPVIGHILSMIRHQTDFLLRLSKHRMPIASLPMLNGKMYAVWDASLIQAVYRNKNCSFEPFVVEFAQRELGYDDDADRLIRENNVVGKMFDAIHEGMGAKHVHRMNSNALRYVGHQLDAITGNAEMVIPNLYIWTRDLMTLATCEALYGPENPFKKDPSLVDDAWTFERDLPMLLLNIFPSVTARHAYQARARLQEALKGYYAGFGDMHEDAAAITRCRAATLRDNGIKNEDVGAFEIALLHVATSNTIPTLFWLLAFVFSRPELVGRLREEGTAAIEKGAGDNAVVNIDTLSDSCPLLVSCYREAIRLCNKAIGNRRVMADTTISDGKGNSYLLKEGVNIQMPSDPLHHLEEVWGPNPEEFDAERFLDQGTGSQAKAKRISYIPFGGGRHLCPGRNFAFAENLGLLVAMLVGFDVTPNCGNDSNTELPAIQRCSLAAAVCKPKDNGNGFGMRMKRREGWESVSWKFTSGAQ